MLYTSNVHGRLKIKGVILKKGDNVDITEDDMQNNNIKQLIITKQLVRFFE